MVAQLEWGDYGTLFGYFTLVIGFGIWSSCKNRQSVEGYFLAGRSMHFVPVGASLFASNIGSGHFIGLAGSGTSSGVGVAGYEITSTFALLILGWIFLPIYLRSGVYTMPEYLKKRFGGDRIRITLSVLSLVAYVFTKISVDLFSGALFIKLSLDLNLYASIGVLIVVAALFTIGGGLSAVIWTDFIQTIIMVLGALYLMITSFIKIGGYEAMKSLYGYSVANTTLHSTSMCGLPPKDYFNLIRNVNSDHPWLGIIVGLMTISVWYWCTDQVIVQRALAARTLNHAKAGCVVASLLKFTPLFIIVFPGMIGRILYKDDVMCTDPEICKNYCNNPFGCSNVAYPRMVIDLMPVGARGLMLAVMMAALMSSLTSVFNSASTIFTMDIYKRFRVKAKDWELMIVGRLFVVFLLILSILSIPIIQNSKDSRLFDYIQSIQSFMSPPICALFVMAVTFKRVNEPGAFWGLLIGFLVGVIRFIVQSFYEGTSCLKGDSQNLPPFIFSMHFLHFAIIIFFVSCFATWIISIMNKPIPDKYIRSLLFSSLNEPEEPIQIPSGKGCGSNGFCATTDLSRDSEDDDISKIDLNENKIFPLVERDVVTIKVAKELNIFKRVLFFICGVNKTVDNAVDGVDVPNETHEIKQENPFWSQVCDICAIGVLMFTGFILAFFNKLDY